MITILTGENSFAITHELQEIARSFDGTAERFDGSELELRQLPDLLMGVSLFSEKRLVIIRGLSQNKAVWDVFGDWLDKVSDDINLVLVEPKLDKRTRTYKELQKVADIREHKAWTLRDIKLAEKWVEGRAEGVLSSQLASFLVARVGVDQWQLSHALDKLSMLDTVTEDTIREVIEAQPSENIFELFETALKGQPARVQEMIETLSLSEDPYQLFGLLSGQAFQLAVIAAARDNDDVGRDLGIHPFVLSRLTRYAKQRGSAGASEIVAAFAAADDAMKTSSIDPWLAIERALLRVASL